jgi:hypothetical protein
MSISYVACGLELHSSFRLRGMSPARIAGLPALALELAGPGELNAAWSGPNGPPAWRGRLGDGHELKIERGLAGDLLFTYGDRAIFRLDSRRRRLCCEPRRRGLDWQRTLIGKVVPSISVMRGYEALHAGAVDSPDGVVGIAGPSGSGKSTLLMELVRRGWLLFADDQLTLQKENNGIRAHPGTPHISLAMDHAGSQPVKVGGTILGAFSGKCWLTADKSAHTTRHVQMICLLERGRDLRLGSCTLTANPLHLAPHVLGLSLSAKRQRSRFCLYSDLVARTALVRLTGSLENTPGELADTIEHALTRKSADTGRP